MPGASTIRGLRSSPSSTSPSEKGAANTHDPTSPGFRNTEHVHLFKGDLTLLVTVEPSYTTAIQGRPSLFWNDLLYRLYRPTTSRTEASVPEDNGTLTIVGYESWPVDILPHPGKLPAGWEGEGCEGCFGDIAPPIPETWRGKHSIEARLKWWIEHWTDAWIHYEAGSGTVNVVSESLISDFSDIPAYGESRLSTKRIRLLTMAEWRAEVGDTYFELMTNPKAVYHSREPLPPFSGLVANSLSTDQLPTSR